MMDRCRDMARELGEAMAGTAPHAPRWLLIEHHGPWGPKGFADSDLPTHVVTKVTSLADEHGVRIQLIRRHGVRLRGLGSTVMVASSNPHDPWIHSFEIRDAEDLLEIPFDDWSTEGAGALGTPLPGAVTLVCTHARRDACCAQFGRPLAAELSTVANVDLWETSHTGGHRFAPNLVVLPEGLIYGQADPPEAVALLARHALGLVDVEKLRGRSFDDAWGQAAETAVRRHTGRDAIGEVLVRSTRVEGDHASVTVDVGDDVVNVDLFRRPSGIPRAVSCGTTDMKDPGVIDVLAMQSHQSQG